MNASPAWPYPRYVAHRGAGRLVPENTLAAMREGFRYGYRMVEFDVKLSADGVPFLMHDDTLDRTTSSRGPADALAWSDLAKLDAGSWHSLAYAGESIPTLAAIAHWAIAHRVACNIEIKPMPGRERDTGSAVALSAQSLWRGSEVTPLLSSFSDSALAAARAAVPELQRLFLVEHIPADWRVQLDRLGCAALGTHYRELRSDIVERIHDAGFKVLTYTPNDVAVVSELASWGIDCIVTDAVNVVKPGQ
jgi:glycerophosphoryl diester phosphodiesterase